MGSGKVPLLALVVAFTLTGCGGIDEEVGMAAKREIDAIPAERREALARSTIYFGHQSVGYNIMEGVVDLTREDPTLTLKVAETADLASNRACFAHGKNGQNKLPSSKIQAFEQMMRSQSPPPDVAFFKFCYVDIIENTDVQTLFSEYRDSLERLKAEFPSTVFVHVTSPLTTVETGPKAWIKRVIGRPLGGVAHNIRRLEFNDLLLREYAGRDPVFDLALAEATRADGTQETFVHKGRSYAALVPGYSDDGSHLNEAGRRWVAAKMLAVIAEAAARPRGGSSSPGA